MEATGTGETALGDRLASEHAARLLSSLGTPIALAASGDHPALAWRRAGLMAVTGATAGRALVCPVALTTAADGALAALRALSPGADLPLCGAALLGERARLLALTRRGATSPNGTCQLLATRDGSIALNLPRADDWASVPALLEAEAADWSAIARHFAAAETDAIVARGRLLGLAIAADRAAPAPVSPFEVEQLTPARSADRQPLVVDLSSLWAGPLAGALLRDCGAEVIKVESRSRPDGAREGHTGFFALLNGGKRSVSLDWTDAADLSALRALVRRADIVVEASRPRALRQLGIDARAEAARGATWVSITAHGRTGPAADWIGFGDDVAVGTGLSAAMRAAWDAPLFAGDAIADPLTGIVAALAGWAGWRQGGGQLVSVPMARVVAHAIGSRQAGGELPHWQALAEADTAPLYPLRIARAPVRPLGADTAVVLAG